MQNKVFNELMNIAGWKTSLSDQVTITGQDPVVPTRFKLGEFTSGIHAACGVAVSNIWELKTGRSQQVEVDLGAAVATLRSCYYINIKDKPFKPQPKSISKFYPTKDGRWFYVHGSFPNTPAHNNIMKVLKCEENQESLAAAVMQWNSKALEDAFAAAGCCGATAYTAEEWAVHPQGQLLRKLPVVEVVKIGDSPPEPFPKGNRPLSGIRVLDLTRVLAGPTCGRTLAEHGAEVMRIGASYLPEFESFIVDTGHGKRSAFIDLNKDDDAKVLWSLAKKADVFSQGYHLGALRRRGFSPEALAEARPGIIYVSINCYGYEGPWNERRGWEQLAQTVSGIAYEEGAGIPRLMSFVLPNDYSTGYLGAFGALVALNRRATEGGSYLVRVSLTQSGMLLNRLGRVSKIEVDALEAKLSSEEYKKLHGVKEGRYGFVPYMNPKECDNIFKETETPFGVVKHMAPVLRLSETAPYWDKPVVPLGTHKPEWLD